MTLTQPDLAAEIAEEIDRYEAAVDAYLAGDLDEDVFRVVRLNQGIYGQRQGGTNQMLRVKIPYGKLTAVQLEMLGTIAREHSRGWGHLTTRQNVQFHFVELRDTPDVLRLLASVGLTSREACGDTVRNVAGCHLAGACPDEVLDISPWAQATADLFLRNPIAQRLPRKFKINFSGCATDCGQALINDVGVIAVSRNVNGAREDGGEREVGFRVFLAGGLGANPHEAQALEEFTSRDALLATIEAIVRTFDHYGNRDNKLRARIKWLVDTMGIEELRERIIKERKFLRASASWPGGVPAVVRERGDRPAGGERVDSGVGDGVGVELGGLGERGRWEQANVVRGRANGTVSAYASCRLGDVAAEQFEGLATVQRDFELDVRITNRQNLVLRDLEDGQLSDLWSRLDALGMAEPGAGRARDVVSCPGADTCNLAVTQSRGLAANVGDALEAAGLGDVGGVRINISGCTNSCGQHHVADIGLVGIERRAHGRSAPGYQMLLGGRVGDMAAHFGERAGKLPAMAVSQAVVQVVDRYATEREAGEAFPEWLERSGGGAGVGTGLAPLDVFPAPDEAPEWYVDFDETGPYEAAVGQSECAT